MACCFELFIKTSYYKPTVTETYHIAKKKSQNFFLTAKLDGNKAFKSDLVNFMNIHVFPSTIFSTIKQT